MAKFITEFDTEKTMPIVCNPNAIALTERGQHTTTTHQLFAAIQKVQELPNGYAFQLPKTPPMLLTAAEFISRESLCCPFLGFAIEIEPENGPLWLRLTGSEEVKQFIQTELGNYFI